MRGNTKYTRKLYKIITKEYKMKLYPYAVITTCGQCMLGKWKLFRYYCSEMKKYVNPKKLHKNCPRSKVRVP